MIYNKLASIFFITALFFSCANETKDDANKELIETPNDIIPEVINNSYVLTRGLNGGEDVIAKFQLLNDSLDKYYIVPYLSDAQQTGDVLSSQKSLAKDLFNNGNYIFIQHSVKDYGEWEKKFLTFKDIRESFGIEIISVLTYQNDPNNVMIIASYTDLHLVSEYGKIIIDAESMDDAGVISTPKILLMIKQ